MYHFSKEQQVFDISGVPVGGQPGEYPTVLFGTVLYRRKGSALEVKPREEVTSQVERHLDLAELTGVSGIVDVFIGDMEHVKPHVDFILEALPDDKPFSVDMPEAEVRVETLKYLGELGVLDRVVYNSLNLGVTDEEIETLRDNTPKASIVLGYNPKDFSCDGRMNILETGAGILDQGLVDIAKDVGIESLLLDTGAVPFAHNACETLRAIPVLKNKWGYPTGCAIHNTVESWLWMKEYRKEHKESYNICDMGSNGLVVQMGGDYVFYGPLRNQELIFPFAAMVDTLMSEGAEDYFGVKPSKTHPRNRLD